MSTIRLASASNQTKYRERIKVMMVLGMILAMIVAGCAEYGARTNMKNFA